MHRPFSPSDLVRLTGKQRATVELLYVENRDASDVARVLMVSPAGLRSSLSHARRKLAAVGVSLADRRRA